MEVPDRKQNRLPIEDINRLLLVEGPDDYMVVERLCKHLLPCRTCVLIRRIRSSLQRS
jgi:hypothetical protein